MRLLIAGDIRAVHLLRYAEYFESKGHKVATLSLEKSGDFTADYQIRASRLPQFLKYPLALKRFQNAITDFKPDLLNCHFIPNYGLLGAMSRFRPLAVNVWGSDVLISADNSWFHRKRVKHVLSRSDVIITDAGMLTGQVKKLADRDKQIITVPFGIERSILDSGRQAESSDSDSVILISTRQLEPLYMVSDLLEAVSILPERMVKKTIIVGGGSQGDDLRQAVTELGLKEIEFTGRVPHKQVFDELHRADIYVSCSRSDSTSVSLLEAMASGLFPVVSDIEGNREWIEHGQNGLLFDVGDIEALARMIRWAAENPSLRQRARKHNFDLIEKNALWENNMASVEEEFERLAGKT